MWGGTVQRNMTSPIKNLPESWDVKNGKNIKWKVQIGSTSYGNPIVADGNTKAPVTALPVDFVAESCYDRVRLPVALRILGVKFDGVLCAAVDAPHVAAEVRRVFDLPGLPAEAAALSVDKFKQKARLHDASLPVPPFRKSGVTGWIGAALILGGMVLSEVIGALKLAGRD